MSYHPRIETPELANLLTNRSRNSELWLVNNSKLEHAILGYLAKFTDRYKIDLFAFAIEGNHLHTIAKFPQNNRASFMRDLNSCVARAVDRHAPEYPGGKFFARRYSSEFMPRPEDIKEYFFYTVLQPVQDGLVEDISDYPGYNCFQDAINETRRIFTVVNWAKYNDDKRWKEDVNVKDYTYPVVLQYERLPGYEDLSSDDYKKMMKKELKERQEAIKKERAEKGKTSVAGVEYLKSVKPGTKPKKTKTSTRNSHRPRILCTCNVTRAKYKAWYFEIYFCYRAASKEYREGNYQAIFPSGTYKPYIPIVTQLEKIPE